MLKRNAKLLKNGLLRPFSVSGFGWLPRFVNHYSKLRTRNPETPISTPAKHLAPAYHLFRKIFNLEL
jgi:hypothetical protein